MALSSYWVSRRRKDLAEQAIVSKREKEAVHAKKCQEVASFHQDLARKCTKYKYLEEAKVLTTPRMREESYVLENQRVAAKEKIDSRRQKLAQLLDVEHKQFMKELKELKEMNREKDPWNITQLKIQMEDLQRQRRETEQNMQKRYLCHMLPSSARSHSSEKENETLERETVVAWEDCKQELERLNLEKQQREQEKLRRLQAEKAEAAHEADKIESLHLKEQAEWSNTIESKISELNTADSESKKLEMEKGILLEHLETLFSLKRRRDAVRDIQRKACQKIQTLYQPNEKMRKMLTEVKHGLEFDYKMLSAMSDLNIDLDEVMAAKEKISMQIALERERELEILQLYQEETSRIWEEKKEQWMLELIAWDEIMNKLIKSLVSQMKEKIDLIESEEKRLINLKENLLEEIDKINLQTKDSCMTLESKHRYYVDQVDKLNEEFQSKSNKRPVDT
ncbi:trichoplein keratin filament-binding protein isoform X2 [Parasteatoda tepidariorum]|uniref:trichoplein keratin filament-binding protein isoform X2 n=1 Tax=Parasteatoda tepidariorum TaxID=114398 RepID=UPI001C71EC4C|nr:trichoplein keratin filament-binding protein isoform X2 [Parasteatoda tepidariorum]